MLTVHYSSSFLRQYKKLPAALKGDVKKSIEEFKRTANHKALGVHTLKGHLKGRSSFSVNYKIRIVFEYLRRSKKEVVLLSLGNHEVYK